MIFMHGEAYHITMNALEPLLVQYDLIGDKILDYVDPGSSLRVWSEVNIRV